MTDIGTSRVFRINPEALDLPERHGRATFTASRQPSSTLVVVAEGDVDMVNHRALARYVEGRILGSSRLVVDLRLVDFFGTAGFAALHNINVISCRHDVRWVLRAGRQVRRLLAICDPDGSLPLEASQSILDDLHAGACDRELLIGRNN